MPRVFSPGDVLAGGYRIEGQLGRGGHAIIYAARDTSDDKPVAIKVIDAEQLTEDARARFLREAAIHRKLTSKHIARVLEAFDLEDTSIGPPGSGGGRLVFLVMERLSGEDADKRVAREGPQPIERAISWILDACDALAEAHAAGVVHRDLKPANLFLVRGPDRPSMVKLLDFGIARLRDAEGIQGRLTTSTAVFGSPAYIAPEQLLSSAKADARSDIYGLGATLFELVTGQVPFPAKNVADMTANIIRDPPRSAHAIRPEVPVSLDRIILKCLAKSPAERYASVIDLRDALVAVLVDPREAPKTIVQSKPPELAVAHARRDRADRTLRKARQRRNLEVGLTVLATMMLVIVVGLTVWLLRTR